MRLTQPISTLIAAHQNDDQQNLLIVSDLKTLQHGYCFFKPTGFNLIEMDVIHHYFDDSLRLLLQSDQKIMNTVQLPILNTLGAWRCTVVERARDGSIIACDASATPVDAHIGLG